MRNTVKLKDFIKNIPTIDDMEAKARKRELAFSLEQALTSFVDEYGLTEADKVLEGLGYTISPTHKTIFYRGKGYSRFDREAVAQMYKDVSNLEDF